MKFGAFPIAESLGGIVAHTIRSDGVLMKKGETVRAQDIASLAEAGIAEITIAMLESGDVAEDAAALRLAEAACGPGLRVERPFTGRANLFATESGVLSFDPAHIDAVNAVDERVTLATLAPMRAVVEGEMAATVKIIPFAVPGEVMSACLTALGRNSLTVEAFRPYRVGVISTVLPGLKPALIDKTLRVLDTRLALMGASVMAHARSPHETRALARAIATLGPGCDILIIFGASAITDRRDVIPAAIEQAGGAVDHFGMPVDPGNLLLLGHLPDGAKVIGAPGCARSPKENGFDFVLRRLMAGVTVSASDIRRMGAGGLLMEIVSRPQPRRGANAVPGDD